MGAPPVNKAEMPGQQMRADPTDAGSWWADLGASVSATHNIEDVAAAWRDLERTGIESPGQSLDFTRAWIDEFDIPRNQQLYVTGAWNGRVVALLPLVHRRRRGVRMLTWFPGAHVGCNAPLIDHDAFARMSAQERAAVWNEMRRGITGADMVRLHAVPDTGEGNYFASLGQSVQIDWLYRSAFSSWDECNRVQRTRSRRKHDRQQGARLAALGDVGFAEISSASEAGPALDAMFRQKAERFREWGVVDPFAEPRVQQFYRDMVGRPGDLQARLHVLTLDGTVVSVRYNFMHGDRVFSLISSMSDCPTVQQGSPGKQNILRAMEYIFSHGYRVCDMGAGFSDEKRHWCNVAIPLRTHVWPLNARGQAASQALILKSRAQFAIKNDPRLFNIAKSLRSFARQRKFIPTR